MKKTSLSDFSRPLSSGIRAINLKEGDELIGVDITDGSNEIMLFSDAGKVARFAEGSGRADADATDEVDTDDDAGNDDSPTFVDGNAGGVDRTAAGSTRSRSVSASMSNVPPSPPPPDDCKVTVVMLVDGVDAVRRH